MNDRCPTLDRMARTLHALRFTAAAAFLLAVGAGGCTVTTDNTNTGHVIAHWTIAGTTDATQCAAHGVVDARVDIVDGAGNHLNSDDLQLCSSFSASFNESFPAGTYTVQTTLLGSDGNPVTTMASATIVVPSDGTTAEETSDFPTSSFLGTTTGNGKLEVDWTIDETADGTLCGTHNAVSARVDVIDSTGTKVNAGADTQTCSSLATSFTQSFNAGTYTVQVTLLDASGAARTTTASGNTTIPSDGTTVKAGFDFPESSFLP